MPIPILSAASRRRGALAGALLLVLAACGGCATYSAKMADLRPELVRGDFEGALATIEKETGSKDQLLYFLERGMVLHYADRWRESNEAFAAAERLSDDLYTKSISEGALSLVSNDNAISYRARPFELAMVPYYKALNYIALGERNEAQVEARRSSLQQAKYVDATLDGLRKQDRGELERVRSNAFMLYTSGMLYDWDGELNDAFIAYRNAAVAYEQTRALLGTEIPPSLARDLVRVGTRLGFSDEVEQVRASCPTVFAGFGGGASGPSTRAEWEEAVRWPAGHGEVVLFVESGFVSQKNQVRFDFPVFESEAYNDHAFWAWQIYAGLGNMQALIAGRRIEYWVSVAAPEMKDAPGPLKAVRVSTGAAGGHAAGVRAENLSRAARITFDAEKPTIFFKTILRGLTKYLASRGAKKAGGDWAGIAANLLGAVTESADTRSWLTLPADVHLVRLTLPEGTWDLDVELIGRDGRPVGARTVTAVDVRAGDWTFLSRRVF
jgi:hypothetical protein